MPDMPDDPGNYADFYGQLNALLAQLRGGGQSQPMQGQMTAAPPGGSLNALTESVDPIANAALIARGGPPTPTGSFRVGGSGAGMGIPISGSGAPQPLGAAGYAMPPYAPPTYSGGGIGGEVNRPMAPPAPVSPTFAPNGAIGGDWRFPVQQTDPRLLPAAPAATATAQPAGPIDPSIIARQKARAAQVPNLGYYRPVSGSARSAERMPYTDPNDPRIYRGPLSMFGRG